MEDNIFKNTKYRGGMSGLSKGKMESFFEDIDDRLNDLEQRVFANDKKILTNLPQQMLLVYHSGMLDKFLELKISSAKLIKLLSLILNASEVNIKKAMTDLRLADSRFRTRRNYMFLAKTFSELKMKKEAEATEQILNEIVAEEERDQK